jgi:hypothetical protein
MANKDYIDPQGYWIDPARNLRRMIEENGEQRVIICATEACSDAEWTRFYEAFIACIQIHSETQTEQDEGGEGD